MLTLSPLVRSRLYRFAIPLSILLLCLPLWFFCGPAPALAPLAVACFSLLITRSLVRQIEKSQAQKCLLDEQLIQSQKLAAIGELSAGIAHEINNPLAIISQEIEWARYQFQEEEPDEKSRAELQDSLNEIARQVDRCREITHKLLDFARKKDPLIQGIDINKLVEDMAKLVERETSQRDIEIVREYQKDLPSVFTDPPLLRQVVLNLLNNAVQAVGQDGKIKIQTQIPENGTVEIGIGDTGCGIPKENVSKIFDPFFTTKPPGKGTGLGLSICHSIIVRLGGRIMVESEPGMGAVFTVRLPVHYKSREKRVSNGAKA
ncbi:MAG: sensor histidine kinase [Syntrophobacteraceae bacterium]